MAQAPVEQHPANRVVNRAGGNPLPLTSLDVGDLHPNVTEPQLFELFSQIGPVVSVRLCLDSKTNQSLGHAYVNYSIPKDGLDMPDLDRKEYYLILTNLPTTTAAMALDVLNFTPLHDKPIRIMYSICDPSISISGAADIFIKNLDKNIGNNELHEIFCSFGNILCCKVAIDAFGQSKGYGFVQFEQEEAAKNAINRLNGMLVNGKPVYVGPFVHKQERESSADMTRFCNVFVKNLSESTTKENLQDIFGKYGKIISVVVMTREDGKSRCFGFINFEMPDAAAQAVHELNGQKFDGKEWYVGKASKKSERELESRAKFNLTARETFDRYHGLNLYLTNFEDNIEDDKLRELFSGFGTITSCKIMRESNGASKGFGFVAFSSAEEAARALSEMNGKMIGGKPLSVTLAQRKAKFQAQFSQVCPAAMVPYVGPRVPNYSFFTPGMEQQMFYGQAPHALVPPQAQFSQVCPAAMVPYVGPCVPNYSFFIPGMVQQMFYGQAPHALVPPQIHLLIPGMRSGGALMPNLFPPVVRQGQQGHQPSGRHARGAVQQMQQPIALIQQQMLPWGHNIPDVPVPGVFVGMNSPYDMGGNLGMRGVTRSNPVPVRASTSALANTTPEQQRMLLGEKLYPLVEQYVRDHAAKVTGMLLEIDRTEILHLLESPDALEAKVAEAMEVLRNFASHDQLSTLSSIE